MRYEEVAAAVEGIPLMTPEQGRRLYDHVTDARPRDILEIGTHYGVSAAYMAAACEANGEGHVTTVDHDGRRGDRAPALLERVGLSEWATVTFIPHSSYNWWLKDRVIEQSDSEGNVEPIYDFCFLDGAHSLSIDGLAVILIEKLLRPGGWLLLDDLDWTLRNWADDTFDTTRITYPFSEEELDEPHVRAVYELIVRQHASFTEFREVDGWWAWARKDPDANMRRLRLETDEQVRRAVLRNLREGKTWLRTRLGFSRRTRE